MKKSYGYVAGIADSARWNAQVQAIRDFGIPETQIVRENCGVNDDRPLFRRLTREILHAGDLLVAASLDGLGRKQTEIFHQWRILRENGIELVILDMPFLNSYTPGDIMRPVMSDIILKSFEYYEGYRYQAACQRQSEKMHAAKERGAQFGRKKRQIDDAFRTAAARWRAGEITAAEAADQLNMSRSTFFRRVNDLDETPNGSPRGA